MTEYEKHGYWWLPESPDKRVAGKLVFGHSSRAKLNLLGSFREEFGALKQLGIAGSEYRPEIVLGLSEDGTRYTLFDCIQAGSTFNTNSFLRESLSPSMVAEGRHFGSSKDMVFMQMGVRLSHLPDWYQVSGRNINVEQPNTSDFKATITYEIPDSLVVNFEGGRIEIAHEGTVNFRGDCAIEERVFIYAFPDQPLHFIEFLNDFLPSIFHFLDLGVGRPLSILEVAGKATADCGEGTNEGIKKATRVRLFWQKSRYDEDPTELHTPYMVFTFPDIRDEVEHFVRQWVQSYREIKPVMQLFFGKVLGRESYSANSFLNSVQAAESYHRYRRGGTDLPEEEHTLRIQSIIESCPDEHKSWLEKRLAFSNEAGLRKRLTELLSERSELFALSSTRIGKLVHRITEIRNHFTHYSGEKDPNFATGSDLYQFDTLLQWTVMACLLEEMGMNRDRAHELIRRNQSFIHFKRVELHKGVIELIKVEEVSADEAKKLEADSGELSDDESDIDPNESEEGMKGTGSQ